MRTFIIRARKGCARPAPQRSKAGKKDHIEILAHCVLNAFFVSRGFRDAVTVYLVFDSSEDFPRTLKLSQSLSLDGFHEDAVISVIEKALKEAQNLKKNETQSIAEGLEISGFGFDKLVAALKETHTLYLLSPKGDNIETVRSEKNPVFILSDHLVLPKKSIKSLKNQGVTSLSLGKQMLFASQCITIIHYELDQPVDF